MAYKRGIVQTTGITEETSTYSMYYDFKEPVAKIVSHRILAINRGEREKFLQVNFFGLKKLIQPLMKVVQAGLPQKQ